MNQAKKRSLYSILFIDAIAIFLVLPLVFFLVFQSPFFPFLLKSTTRAKWFLFTLVVAAFPLGQAIGVPFIGNRTDQTNKKKVFLLAIAGEAFGFFLSAAALFAHNFFFFLISRFITGFFAANFALCFSLLTGSCKNGHHLRQTVSRITMMIIAGFAVAISLTTLFSDNRVSSFTTPSLAFLIAGLLTVGNCFIIHFSKQITFSGGRSRTKHWFIKLKKLLKASPELKKDLVLFLLLMVALTPPLAFFSSFILGKYAMGKGALFGLFLVLGLVWIAGLQVSSKWSDLFGEKRLILLTLLLLTISGLALTFNMPITPFFPLLCLFQLCGSLLTSLFLSNIAHACPQGSQGLALGSAQSLGFIAGSLGPLFAFFLLSSSTHLKMANLFIVSFLFSLATFVYYVWTKKA